MLRGANYSLRGLNVPNELIRRVACRLDLHHLKPRDEPTGAAAPSPEVRSCGGFGASPPINERNSNVLTLFL